MTIKKGNHPTNRAKVSISAKQGTVMHQDRKGTGEHLIAIPEQGKEWSRLPQATRKALMRDAIRSTERLKKKLS